MIKAKVTGVTEFKLKMENIKRGIENEKKKAQELAANFGEQEAKKRVPVDTGETHDWINSLDFPKESWILSVTSPTDLIPVNVYINEELVDLLQWGNRRSPKTGEFHFMDNTVEPTTQEFISLLNLGLSRII